MWNVGYPTPAHKFGNKVDITNYRGVNVSHNLGKCFQIFVFNQIRFTSPHISPGFFLGRRVESYLMEFFFRVHHSHTDIFYADIHNAFDVNYGT